jgi:hypothetical protein
MSVVRQLAQAVLMLSLLGWVGWLLRAAVRRHHHHNPPEKQP